MTTDKILDDIRRHEGFSDRVYLDTVGVPTGGYGHAFHVGTEIPVYVAEALLWLDYRVALNDYQRIKKHLRLDLSTVREGVLINMIFNLGRPRFMKFKKFLKALQEKKYKKASEEMLNSRWASQVGDRATELAQKMRDDN